MELLLAKSGGATKSERRCRSSSEVGVSRQPATPSQPRGSRSEVGGFDQYSLLSISTVWMARTRDPFSLLNRAWEARSRPRSRAHHPCVRAARHALDCAARAQRSARAGVDLSPLTTTSTRRLARYQTC